MPHVDEDARVDGEAKLSREVLVQPAVSMTEGHDICMGNPGPDIPSSAEASDLIHPCEGSWHQSHTARRPEVQRPTVLLHAMATWANTEGSH